MTHMMMKSRILFISYFQKLQILLNINQ